MAYHRDRQDSLVLAALQGQGPVAFPLTILQLVERLPALPWREVFQTVGRLQLRGAIVLLPRGFDFYVSLPEDAMPLPDFPGGIHPPTQEATAVKPWRNARRVSSEALAKEDMLRRVSPKKQEGPRLPGLRSRGYFGGVG